MQRKKKAGARALSCACALALAASMAPAAALSALADVPDTANAKAYVNVGYFDKDGKWHKVTASPTAVALNGLEKTTAATQFYSASEQRWYTAATDSYVTLDTILKKAGLDNYWAEGSSLWMSSADQIAGVLDGTTTGGKKNFTSYEDLANMKFYPSCGTGITNQPTTGATPVEPGLALNLAYTPISATVTGWDAETSEIASMTPNTAEAAAAVVEGMLEHGTLTTTTGASANGVNAPGSNENVAQTVGLPNAASLNAQSGYVTAFGPNSTTSTGPWALKGLGEAEYQSATDSAVDEVVIPGATDSSTPPVASMNIYIALPEATAVSRIQGKEWANTMEALYKQTFKTDKQDAWVVATAGGFQDALAASGLAGALECPIVMTDGDSLTSTTASIINRYSNVNATVYIVGGKAAVSESVERAIRSLPVFYGSSTLTIKRLSGKESWDTAMEVRNWMVENSGNTAAAKPIDNTKRPGVANAIVCTSGDFADAMSVSPYAYATGTPIILTNNEGYLSSEVAKSLGVYEGVAAANKVVDVLIVGGKAAVSPLAETQLDAATNINRVAGLTAYDTSNQIANALITGNTLGTLDTPVAGDVFTTAANFNTATSVCVATGENYLDALAASMFAGSKGYTLCLVSDTDETTINGAIADHAKINAGTGQNLETAYVIGGKAAVGEKAFADVNRALTVKSASNEVIK